MNAASLIAIQTALNDTSFVSVYPCKTLGSARLVVVADVQGVGKFKDSSPFALFEGDGVNVSIA